MQPRAGPLPGDARPSPVCFSERCRRCLRQAGAPGPSRSDCLRRRRLRIRRIVMIDGILGGASDAALIKFGKAVRSPRQGLHGMRRFGLGAAGSDEERRKKCPWQRIRVDQGNRTSDRRIEPLRAKRRTSSGGCGSDSACGFECGVFKHGVPPRVNSAAPVGGGEPLSASGLSRSIALVGAACGVQGPPFIPIGTTVLM